MSSQSMKNDYLEQVVQEKAKLENDLRVNRATPAKRRRMRPFQASAASIDMDESRASAPAAADSGGGGTAPVDVRITGWWRWKNVIVPPNAYVVHTRRGYADPLHVGLGVSFRFNPITDAFLVVPAAMQTIIIHANCICKERQGVVVQGYVQWIIDDFETAYRKLDFTDPEEPMRVVNVQLKEQAEAAIKDKVATMSIDEVLADKQPIIKELTARLSEVAEGHGADKGLGLRIVTVQIKEAVVCSPKVWEMLQRPFRSERSKEARLSELENLSVVQKREAESKKHLEELRINSEAEVGRLKAEADAARFEREQAEEQKRAALEAQSIEETVAHQRTKLQLEAELSKIEQEVQLVMQRRALEMEKLRAEQEIELLAARRKVENEHSEEAVRLAMIEAMPKIAKELPKAQEMKVISLGERGELGSLVSSIGSLVDQVKKS